VPPSPRSLLSARDSGSRSGTEGLCSTGEFVAASLLRRTVYFLEGHIYRGFRLYEYVLHDVVTGDSNGLSSETAPVPASRCRSVSTSDMPCQNPASLGALSEPAREDRTPAP
jgi:hypothetical protein